VQGIRDYFGKCWKNASEHWSIAVLATLSTVYSILTASEPLVNFPEWAKAERWPKLPVAWASAIAFAALFWIVLEGGCRLRQKTLVEHAAELTGEKEKQKAPRLFFDFDNVVAAQYAMTYSGLFLKNDGGRAFNVTFEPETRAGLTLRIDRPLQSVNTGNGYPIHLLCCSVEANTNGLFPVGGMQSGQIQNLFERLSDEGEVEGFTITIRCLDYNKTAVESRSVLRWDIWTKQIRCERI
jgi:hypothetical protein